MRAILCRRLDGPAALTFEEVAEPTPGLDEVTIDVRAAALNFADILMTRGTYQEKPTLPFTPGMELAGRVRAVGADVAGFELGERVLAVVDHGAFAEVAKARAVDVVPIGDAVADDVAAGFPIAYGTAHGALAWRAGLRAGETLLVHGAAGGVGLTAVEVGVAMGARVIATARGAERLELARRRGAAATIDTASEDVRARVLALTENRGVDVCFDPVGGELGEISLRCLAWEGRYLVIGFAAGDLPTIKANRLLVKNVAAIGFYWGGYRRRDPARLAAGLTTLLGWYAEGRLHPHVSRRFPLAEAAAALAQLEQRRSTGKVVLDVG
ncbi:MAG: zinc-binding dehydrogenase [Alphaproteobacteria bacterium]|jgi:NADPH2:quinone reductase|nr:zinc-binding dehydrogenase [Alphaproteobacteria bacterium]